jgi:hypothetical protein
MAVLTTVVSIFAACLDEALEADKRFFPNWLNGRLRAHLSKHGDGNQNRRCRLKFWRKVLECLMIALADQQLITGFAVLITGLIVYHEHFHGAHFTLVVYLSCLSSSSHLAAIITLRQYFIDNHALAKLRVACIWAFAVLLGFAIPISKAFGPFSLTWFLVAKPDRDTIATRFILTVLSVWQVAWFFWTGTWHLSPPARQEFHKAYLKKRFKRVAWRPICRTVGYHPSKEAEDKWNKHTLHPRRVLRYLVFLTPFSVFVLQITFAAFSVALALAQKFTPVSADSDMCSLRSKQENEMGYGQILAILLLILPAIAAYEAYKGTKFPRRAIPIRLG